MISIGLNLDSNYLVDILMPTYNHEKFISEAIQSVVKQECTFAYRLIIGDDHSNDGTNKICKDFAEKLPEKICLISQKNNIGMAANYKFLFQTSKAKYVAILEGDDYWTDMHKLQKQVDILENNSDIGLVHTNYYSLYENEQKKKGHLFETIEQNSGNVIGPTHTATININPLTSCFRADLAKQYVDFDFIISNKLLTVDVFLWAEICRRSQVAYIDQVTGVYRVHSAAITGNRNIEAIEKFSKTSHKLVNYLMDKYEASKDVRDNFNSELKFNLIYHYLLANHMDKARMELQNIKVIKTYRQKMIYLSARYKILHFLVHTMAYCYQVGSKVKQSIGS